MTDSIPKRITPFYAEINFNDLDPEDSDCVICFDSLLPDPKTQKPSWQGPPVRLSCSHIFGEYCVSNWLMSHPTCPHCRTIVQEIASPELDTWRHERGNVLRDIQYIIRDKSQPSWRYAQRLEDFLQGETSKDTVPCRPLRQMMSTLALNPARMTNDWMKAAITRWSEALRYQSFAVAVRRDIELLIRALDADIEGHVGM